MKTVEVPASNKQLRAMVEAAQGGTVLLTSGGKPVAALVGIENADAESVALTTSPKFLKVLQRSLAELKNGKAVGLEEMRKRVGAD